MEICEYDLLSIQEVRILARKGKEAQEKLARYTETQIEKIVANMVKVAEEHAEELAEMAVMETGFGKISDKIFKNHHASTNLYQYIKDMKTVGIIERDDTNKVLEIAEPMGLLMGIVPSTNPTSTVIYKAIISLKSRNGIVFSPHPSALKCTLRATELMNEAAVAAGAPEGIVSCISKPSMQGTNELMRRDEIALIIATGGSAMVKSAYSVGKPALGVGPGNVPCYIERTADIPQAVANVIASKTFDYGTICASEQTIIVETIIEEKVVAEFQRQGAYFMTTEETEKVAAKLFVKGHVMSAKMVGRSPQVIAEAAGITIPANTKVLIGRQNGVGEGHPLSYEKLTTVLGFYTVNDWQEACELSIALLNNGGVGHSFAIHTNNPDIVMKFSEKPVFRILVNTGSTQGGVGVSSGLAPAFTLGCGTWGGSATSDNVTPRHLVNIKRVAYGIKECVSVPETPAPSIAEEISNPNITALVTELMTLLEKSGVK
ncbi:acetaldehyde dehydrogenase (acetylating) [Enterococcus sp. PF1-24]|uniref:acetaldehyde dehydrogenase (acetylating) n=1 Tax=unclassified Enterococcus TaxID=2608891 RepID=UPI002473BB31|nr:MULTISPECIES: acetaldehyde dehydrogenase (acetylating) [unclassified Enterococcus]MDH6364090.1 acetaldehyde dehydrogenase (acetylating) [Enterococcus sp. PFB1-1]MDH6401191.1 acetaldehyde dehydrogenase (acetylating) [Enterococcus sp. PF1-24]